MELTLLIGKLKLLGITTSLEHLGSSDKYPFISPSFKLIKQEKNSSGSVGVAMSLDSILLYTILISPNTTSNGTSGKTPPLAYFISTTTRSEAFASKSWPTKLLLVVVITSDS